VLVFLSPGLSVVFPSVGSCFTMWVREYVFGFVLREATIVASIGNSHTFGRNISLSDERFEVFRTRNGNSSLGRLHNFAWCRYRCSEGVWCFHLAERTVLDLGLLNVKHRSLCTVKLQKTWISSLGARNNLTSFLLFLRYWQTWR